MSDPDSDFHNRPGGMHENAAPLWTRAPENVENAIIEGDIETLRHALPALTGTELDECGFPLLFLAMQQEQPEIFALLLESGKFRPSLSGPDPLALETDGILKSLGCETDNALERQWGMKPNTRRLALFEKLLHHPVKHAPESARIQKVMLRILVKSPHAALQLSERDLWALMENKLAGSALVNPSTRLMGDCIAHLLNPESRLRKRLDATTPPEFAATMQHRLDSLFAQADKSIVLNAMKDTVINDDSATLTRLITIHGEKLHSQDVCDLWLSAFGAAALKHIPAVLQRFYPKEPDFIVKLALNEGQCISGEAFMTLLSHLPMAELSPELINHALYSKYLAPDAKGRGSDSNRRMVETLWPYIDINTITSYPGERDAPHLLARAIGSFGGDLSRYDLDLANKIIADPRLDLPPGVLAEIYLECVKSVLGDMDVFGQSNKYNPQWIAALKNFDPNARIRGSGPLLLTEVFRECTHMNYCAPLSHLSRLPEDLLNHPDFDPYTEIDGEDLADYLETNFLKKAQSSNVRDLETFTGRFITLLKEKMASPGEAVLQSMAKDFEHKIPPEELAEKPGIACKSIRRAARAGRLPELLNIPTRARDLQELYAYETALSDLLPSFPSKCSHQIRQCLEQIAETRPFHVRNIPCSGFKQRYLRSKQDQKPENQKG